MATLEKIAREYADLLRDGIAWVLVWKTGRSWNATAVWLRIYDETFEPDDLATAREVLEKDPNAVMVNGYHCGHFGERMTVAELTDGIRWHYERGCNKLDGSTAFPPEPVERSDDLPDEIPWYEMPAAEAPDPYIYDGGMSLEDFLHRQELIEMDILEKGGINLKAESGRCRKRDCRYASGQEDRLLFNCNYLSITGHSRTAEICDRAGIPCSDPRRHALLIPSRCPLYEPGKKRKQVGIVLKGSRRRSSTQGKLRGKADGDPA